MPVNMQNLQNLASITDITQLKVGADNQLQQRSAISTFFRKVGDAFLGLSQAGRASIAQRNEGILNAMRAAVDNARATVQAEDKPMAERLTSVFQRLQTASTNTEALNSLKSSITGLQTQAAALKHGLATDPRFTALSPRAQQGLCHALDTVEASTARNKASAKERLKNDFFGLRPNYDIERGMQSFSDDLVSLFLSPTQQKKVDESGIHVSFVKDTVRGNISNIGDVETPNGQPREFYENALRNLIPPQHQRFLPFISMMTSQAGLDSAMVFLPFMADLSDSADTHLTEAEIMPVNCGTNHKVSVTREGDTLQLTDTFDRAYTIYGEAEGSSAVLRCKGNVTMTIDLSAEPRREMVNDKEVLVPQFRLENGNAYFEAP